MTYTTKGQLRVTNLQSGPTTSIQLRLAGRAVSVTVDLDQVARRAVQDAMAMAIPATWRYRAAAFEAARPRPGDYTGRASVADLKAADSRCAEMAALCRVHAGLLSEGMAEAA